LHTARPDGTFELTIVHLDENDYQEEKTSRNWTRLSDAIGSWQPTYRPN